MAQDSLPGPEGQTPGSGAPVGRLTELQRRRLFTIVAVVGLSGLTLGILGILGGIGKSFPRLDRTSTNTTATSAELEALKQQDTDDDGLSDYDEIFTYHTSVFVQDTDSDKLTDYDELQSGTDPNCPIGKTCGLAVLSNTNTATGASAANLRAALQKAGVPLYILNQTNDADLLALYNQTIQGGNVNALPQTGLSQLTPAEIRELLLASGVSSEDLKNVDDATLIEIFQSAIGTQP